MTAILNVHAYSTPAEKTAAEAAAVLRHWEHEQVKGTNGSVVMVREWKFEDKRTADGFAAALTSTVVSPKADNQTYSGTWVSQKPEIEGDEAPTVVQTLVLPDTDGFTIDYDESADIAVSTTYYFDYTRAQYEDKADVYDTPTDGVTVNVSNPQINRNGLIDFNVESRTRQYRTRGTPAGAFSTGVLVKEDKFEEAREWEQSGLTTQTERSIAQADGYVKVQGVDLLPDGSKKVMTREREATKDVAVGTDTRYQKTETDATVKVVHDDTAETGSQADGTIVEVNNQLDEFGEYTTAKRTRTATKDVAAGTDTRYLKTETDATVKVIHDDTVETGSQADGTIVEVANQIDEFGEYTTAKRTRTATKDIAAGTDTRYLKSETASTVKVIHDDEVETGSQADGTIVEVNNQIDEFGEYTTAKTTRTANKDLAAGTDATQNVFETRSTAKVIHDDAVETHSFTSGSIIQSVRNDVDEFGEYTTAKETRTANLNVSNGHDGTVDAFESRTTQKTIHATTPSVPGYLAGSSITTARNTRDEFGAYTTAQEIRSCKKDVAEGTDTSYNKFETDSTVKVLHDQAAETTSQADGTVTSVRNTIDEFGNYTTRKQTRTAEKDVAAGTDTRYLKSETDATVKVIHDDTVETGSQADGTIVEVTNQIDEFGEYTTAKRTRTATKDLAAGTDTRYLKTETDVTVKVVHDDTVETGSQADGTIVEVSNQIDEFGEYTTAKRTRTAEKDVAAGTDTLYNKFETDATVKVIHDDTVETGSQADGTVVHVRNQIDEFGEYTTAKTTRTANKDIAIGTDTTEDLFESRSTDKLKHDDAAETGTFTSGTSIQSVRNEMDEFGEYSTAKETRTAKAVSDARKEYIETAERSTTITTDVHQSTADGAPSQADGYILRVTDVKDEFGTYTSRTEDTVINDTSVSAYTAIKTEQATTTREVFSGAATAPALTEQYGSLQYAKNRETGRYDGVKHVVTPNIIPGYWVGVTGQTYVAISRQQGGWRKVTTTYNISYFNRPSLAQAYINAGYSGSKVEQVRGLGHLGGIWRAVLVTGIVEGSLTAYPVNAT